MKPLYGIAIAVICAGLLPVVLGLRGYWSVLSTHCSPFGQLCPIPSGTSDLVLAGLGSLAVCLGVTLLFTEKNFQPRKISAKESVFVSKSSEWKVGSSQLTSSRSFGETRVQKQKSGATQY